MSQIQSLIEYVSNTLEHQCTKPIIILDSNMALVNNCLGFLSAKKA